MDNSANNNSAPCPPFALGIDLGTTSVKLAIVDGGGRVVENVTVPSLARVVSAHAGGEGAEQCPLAIWTALQSGLRQLDPNNQVKVQTIGVSGQMHGLLLWQQGGRSWQRQDDQARHIDLKNVSRLVTWEDKRCSRDFLLSLPAPDSSLTVSSGYGCATYLWLLANQPQYLAENRFDCAGTIMDFVVAAICDLERPVTSDQLAASFGYFNVRTGAWNTEILQSCGFPVDMLPAVQRAGHTAGHLQQGLEHIPAGTPVLVAMGDMQCGVLSALHSTDDAMLNISTSIQLSVRVDDWERGASMGEAVTVVPYFDDVHLAVVAGLNGGNVLAAMAALVKSWLQELGLGGDVIETVLLDRLSSLAQNTPNDSTLTISPTVFGERHDTALLASAEGISAHNASLGAMFRAASEGIVDNIFRLLPPEVLAAKGVKRVVGSGSVLRNPLVSRRTQDILAGKLDFVQGTDSDSAFGAAKAALAVLRQ